LATTITGLAILKQAVRRGGLGLYLDNADIAVAAGTLTSVKWFRNPYYSTNEFRDRNTLIYRPSNATGVADYVRGAGDLAASTGVLNIDANWADTTLGTEDVVLLDHNVHPQWVVDAMNRAMTKRCYFENLEPLSLAADSGFQSTSTGSYTASGTTFTKVTTADSFNIFTGIGSGRTATADGYITQTFAVHPNEQLSTGALARADAGTASLVLFDVTNSAAITSANARSHTGENWAYLSRTDTVPATCETVGLRLTVGDTGDVYWNGAWFYRTRDNFIRLSSTWDTAFKVPALAYMDFGASVSSGVEAAFSRRLTEVNRSLYSFQMEKPGANPYGIQFHQEGMLNRPLYIQGRRAYGDLTTFTLGLSETTACDIDLIDAATRLELFSDEAVIGRVPRAAERLAQAKKDLDEASKQFVSEGPAEKVSYNIRQRSIN
jgi:hypothetical protein